MVYIDILLIVSVGRPTRPGGWWLYILVRVVIDSPKKQTCLLRRIVSGVSTSALVAELWWKLY